LRLLRARQQQRSCRPLRVPAAVDLRNNSASDDRSILTRPDACRGDNVQVECASYAMSSTTVCPVNATSLCHTERDHRATYYARWK
jgi:hypothetical protein